jgi:hypothetical protein
VLSRGSSNQRLPRTRTNKKNKTCDQASLSFKPAISDRRGQIIWLLTCDQASLLLKPAISDRRGQIIWLL